jgi:hypothetical protein
MELIFHMDFPIRPSPSPTGHTLPNKNLIIFLNSNMLHRMEHVNSMTEEEEAILLQDELNHPPSATNEQQQQKGVMGHPVLPVTGSNGGEEAQKALEGLKGLRVDDGEKKKKKNKSGAEKKRRRKAKLAAASTSGAAPGLPPAPSTPKPHVEELNVPRVIVVARPPRQDTTKPKVDFHNPQQRRESGQGPSTGAQAPSRAQKRALPSPESPEDRKPPKRPSTFRQAAEGALRVFVTYSDTGRGGLNATDYASICAELRKAIDELHGQTQTRIAGVFSRRGYVEIHCHDETTKLWVELEVPKIRGGLFRASNEAPIKAPKYIVGVWIREDPLPKLNILFSRISTQNNNINTSDWRLLSATKKGSGNYLALELEAHSAEEVLPPRRLYYYTDVLSFKCLRGGPKVGEASEATEGYAM